MRIVWQASTMPWWSASSLSTGSAYMMVFRCPENSNLACSVKDMQWVLLYLSTGHDRCYCEHLAQHGAPSCMYHIFQ
jgi:hypothetical protein